MELAPRIGRPPAPAPAGFPSRLRKARESAELAPADAADKVGVDPETWRAWERGDSENLSFENGLRAAELLKVDPFQLWFGRKRKQ